MTGKVKFCFMKITSPPTLPLCPSVWSRLTSYHFCPPCCVLDNGITRQTPLVNLWRRQRVLCLEGLERTCWEVRHLSDYTEILTFYFAVTITCVPQSVVFNMLFSDWVWNLHYILQLQFVVPVRSDVPHPGSHCRCPTSGSSLGSSSNSSAERPPGVGLWQSEFPPVTSSSCTCCSGSCTNNSRSTWACGHHTGAPWWLWLFK